MQALAKTTTWLLRQTPVVGGCADGTSVPGGRRQTPLTTALTPRQDHSRIAMVAGRTPAVGRSLVVVDWVQLVRLELLRQLPDCVCERLVQGSGGTTIQQHLVRNSHQKCPAGPHEFVGSMLMRTCSQHGIIVHSAVAAFACSLTQTPFHGFHISNHKQRPFRWKRRAFRHSPLRTMCGRAPARSICGPSRSSWGATFRKEKLAAGPNHGAYAKPWHFST